MSNKLTSLSNKIKKYINKTSKKKIEDLDQYFVKITQIYKDEFCHEIMIRYHVMPNISDVIPCKEFMNSPLIYAVHPKQLYFLGIQSGDYEIEINTTNHSTDFHRSKQKRILH